MIDIQSIAIYLGLASLSFIIAKYAELHNSKKAVWMIVILLSLIAGLRSISVGIDTKTYDMVFSLVSKGYVEEMYGLEESFIYICAALLRIWDNNQFLLFLFAFSSHGLIVFRLWKDREYIAFRWSVFSYYILFYTFSLNGIRQFVAVAIIIHATDYVRDGKYGKYLIFIVIASFFHTSALIGIAYVLFEFLFTYFFSNKRKLSVFVFFITSLIISVLAADKLLGQYGIYLETRAESVGIMMIAKLIMLFATIIILKNQARVDYQYIYSSYKWYYFVGLALNSLNYLFMYAGRIGLYFYVFEPFFLGYVFKAKNYTVWVLLLKFGYAVLLMYYLYQNLTSNAQGELPYRFFWQS